MTRSACKDKENEILEILPIRNRLGLWSPFLVEENIGSCCCAGLFAFTLHSAHSGAVHISCQQLQQLTNWQNIVFWFLYIIYNLFQIFRIYWIDSLFNMQVFWDLWIQWSNCPYFVAKKDLHWIYLVEKGKSGYSCQDAKFRSTPNPNPTRSQKVLPVRPW